MLGQITTIATIGTHTPHPVDSQLELKASKNYIINTDNIVSLKVYSTDDSEIRYKFNSNEDRSPEFLLRVTQTNAQVQALADVAAASNMILLNVYVNEEQEDCMTFAECALAGSSTVAKYYAIADITWIEENATGTLAMMWVNEGGWGSKKIFVDYNLDQIMDLLTTGTTTTTTSSTSTTTASQ